MIITLFSGAPPEGDGPSQRKVLTAGREIQGDTDRKDSDRYWTMPIPKFQGCGDREGHPEEEGQGDGNQDWGGTSNFYDWIIVVTRLICRFWTRSRTRSKQRTSMSGSWSLHWRRWDWPFSTFSIRDISISCHSPFIFCNLIFSGQGKLTPCQQLNLTVNIFALP